MNLNITDINTQREIISMINKLESYSCGNDTNLSEISKNIFAAISNKDNKSFYHETKLIRNSFINLFDTKEFKKFYFNLVKKICEKLQIYEEILLQKTPTPRIVPPNSLATSFHCDNWYGHGHDTYTVWTPFHKLKKGSGVFFVEEENDNVKLHKNFNDEKNYSEALKKFNDESQKLAHEFIPSNITSRVFGSSIIHGSPKNTSDEYRFSFDFRFSTSKDIGSKNYADFYIYDPNKNKIRENIVWPKKSRFLKYINGENFISTKSQHMLIENFSLDLGLRVFGQEAEIENGNYSVLLYYLNQKNLEKNNFDGIIIASESVLDKNLLNIIKKSKIKIIFALERKTINLSN